jgi:quercetin dioxygenase-like cupin family protein
MTSHLHRFDAAEPEQHPWGWLRWLMSGELDPGAAQTVGIVQINPGQRNPLHLHPNCEELLYVTAGVCEHTLGDDTVTMKVGDLIRIPVNVPHCARCAGDEPLQAFIVFSAPDRQTTLLE